MSRRFIRPLFSFWDPFFPDPIYVRRVAPSNYKPNRAYRIYDKKQELDPHQTFDNFFKDFYENSSHLRPEERQFFEKHYPEKVAKKFNPYEVLGIDQNADIEKIKEAYRTKAIKYHPKTNQSLQAQQKFNDISRAYNQLIAQKQSSELGEDISVRSFFEDFNKELENFLKVETTNKKKIVGQEKSGQKVQKCQQKENDTLKGAELYSESSYYEEINGKRKCHITKMYEKDGKKIKIDRVEQNRGDGSIEVTQTFDDGKEVKNKKFIQAANKKQQYLS